MHGRALLGGIFPLSISLLLSACSSGDIPEGHTSAATNALVTSDLALTGSRHIAGTVKVPASLALRTTVIGCNNRGGPDITLEGTVTLLEDINADIIAKNNAKGTHTAVETARANVVLTKIGTRTFPKRMVTGNPLIAAQVLDSYGQAIGSPIDLGRCNGAGKVINTTINFIASADLDVDVSALNCDNTGGPNINLDGAVVFGGLNVRFTLGNRPGNKKATTDAELQVVLSLDDTVTFPKQYQLGGAGGNPMISVDILGHVFDFGRCNKI